MSAFFIATIKMKNPEKFAEYSKMAGPIVAEFGGEFILRGKAHSVLAGGVDVNAAGIARFPSAEAITNWYNSDAYQAIVPLREEAAEMTFVVYEEPTA